MESTRPLEVLGSKLALLLSRAYTADSTDPTTRARSLKEAAALLIDARQMHFMNPALEVGPDWLGRSRAYKDWVTETFSRANIPRTDKRRLQDALSYHVSVALRTRIAEEGLDPADIGLSPHDAREKRDLRRDREREVLRLFDPEADLTVADLDLLARLVLAVLRRLSPEHSQRFVTTFMTSLRAGRLSNIVVVGPGEKAPPQPPK